jgi:hypothetical protein
MRNIIIYCDGTGNEIAENISNVLKLYRCLRKTEKTMPRRLLRSGRRQAGAAGSVAQAPAGFQSDSRP